MRGDTLGPVSTREVVHAEKLRMKFLCTERKDVACSCCLMIDSAPVVVYCLFVLSGHQSEEDVSDEMIRRRQEYGEYFRQGHGKENNRQ